MCKEVQMARGDNTAPERAMNMPLDSLLPRGEDFTPPGDEQDSS